MSAELTLAQKSSAEATGTTAIITLNDNFTLAGLVDVVHDVFDLSSSTDTVLEAFQGFLAVLKLLLEHTTNVITSLCPLSVLEFDLELVGLDTVLHLVTGAVKPLAENCFGRFQDSLTGEGVAGEAGVANKGVDMGLDRRGNRSGGQTPNTELCERGCRSIQLSLPVKRVGRGFGEICQVVQVGVDWRKIFDGLVPIPSCEQVKDLLV
ncbi:hypothetical protein HG531_004415 [Fusarium graminearum]|nr:hypothetical protein HG531_004415 [Fusarium graminearum]